MKQFLVCLMIFVTMSIFSGCGENTQTSEGDLSPVDSIPVVQEASHEIETEKGLVFENTDVEEAYQLGILEYEEAKRLDENAMQVEVTQMINKVFELRYKKESPFLTDMLEYSADDKFASRYWFGIGIYYPRVEEMLGVEYDNYQDYFEKCNDIPIPEFFMPSSAPIGMNCANFIFDNSDIAGTISEASIFTMCTDVEDLVGEWPNGAPEGVEWNQDFGNWWVAQTCSSLYDRRTGQKVLGMTTDGKWYPQKAMTIEDAAKAAMRYYYSFEVNSDLKLFSEVMDYDNQILTETLLNKETSLPDASCSELPASWHGVLLPKLGSATYGALYSYPDKLVREMDIQTMKEAGLNNLVMFLSFSYLQGPDYVEGMVNEQRLKMLDEILAICIENDVHLTIQCSQKTGFTGDSNFETGSINEPQNEAEIAEFAEFWQMLARRYKAIPNQYLAFDLMVEPEIFSETRYGEVFTPAVEAIREESPERVIIADIHSGGLSGETMAKLGVAISYHQYAPRSFCVISQDYLDNTDYLKSVTWPYVDASGKTYDASVVASELLDDNASTQTSYELMKALAAENNVGFIVGEFGLFEDSSSSYSLVRYPKETYLAYYKDMIDKFSEDNVPWVIGGLNSSYSFAQCYPVYEDVTYKQIGYYYLDTDLCQFFKQFEE